MRELKPKLAARIFIKMSDVEEDDDEGVVEKYDSNEEEDEVYEEDDDSWMAEIPKKEEKRDKELVQAEQFFTGSGSREATQRLIKDINLFVQHDTKKFGISAGPVDDNLYLWHVLFFGFEPGTPLAKDMEAYKKNTGKDAVELEMRFPAGYPWAPPFIFVKRPRFQFHTGHVTIGGSICMEMLTTAGWTPANAIESILIQIRAEIIAGNARLDLSSRSQEYSEDEARSSFLRVARQHGWEK